MSDCSPIVLRAGGADWSTRMGIRILDLLGYITIPVLFALLMLSGIQGSL